MGQKIECCFYSTSLDLSAILSHQKIFFLRLTCLRLSWTWWNNRVISWATFEKTENLCLYLRDIGYSRNMKLWIQELGVMENRLKVYYGLTARTFKLRFNEHKTSITNEAYRNKGTTLSAHIWWIKDMNVNYELKFSIVKLANAYSKEAKVCSLCLQEKACILFSDHYETLNKRSEIMYKCVHRARHLLERWGSITWPIVFNMVVFFMCGRYGKESPLWM